MRKNLQKLAAKLRIRITEHEACLERLRHDMELPHAMLEAAQVAADESRRTFDQLRTTRPESTRTARSTRLSAA